METKPKFELDVYRQFIRDAAAFVSLIAGRKIKAAEAELLTDAEITTLALKIDERVDDINKKGPLIRPSPDNSSDDPKGNA